MKGEGTMKKMIYAFVALVALFTILFKVYGTTQISYKVYTKYETQNQCNEKILVKCPENDEWMVAGWRTTFADGEVFERNWK